MLPTPQLQPLRAAVARAERRRQRTPDDPAAAAAVVEVRRDLKAETLAAIIAAEVDSWPQLTADQRHRLAGLLRGAA